MEAIKDDLTKDQVASSLLFKLLEYGLLEKPDAKDDMIKLAEKLIKIGADLTLDFLNSMWYENL